VRTWPALVVTTSPAPAVTSAGDSASFPDLVQAALMDFVVAAIDEPSPDSLRAFFHDPAERDRAAAALPEAFPDLQFTAVDVPDEDWAARSQANLTAITVGELIVAPPWDVPGASPVPERRVIVIQPSMGFGTGHHATTRLCLKALQHAHAAGRSVIDVGTGSGVLAIAASLLGASPVIALDDDADAIQSARENLELNPGAHVDFRVGDLRTSVPGVADLVLANLTGTLLVQAAQALQSLLSPSGRLILSGLMVQEEAAVIAAFPELRVLDRSGEDEWVCLVLGQAQRFQ
jgi:ribosomal protein L11 methyltransferase